MTRTITTHPRGVDRKGLESGKLWGKKNLYIHTHIHIWWYIHVCTMGRGPRVWQALGRDGGWMGGKLRAKPFFVKCPDGSEKI